MAGDYKTKLSLQFPKDNNLLKYNYPDGTHCYRALHTTHAVYRSEDGKLIARADRPDRNGTYEFEITSFELLESGRTYD